MPITNHSVYSTMPPCPAKCLLKRLQAAPDHCRVFTERPQIPKIQGRSLYQTSMIAEIVVMQVRGLNKRKYRKFSS